MIQEKIRLQEAGVRFGDLRRAVDGIREGMEATRVKVLQHKGQVLYSEPLPDYDVRHRYDVTMLEMVGALTKASVDVDVNFAMRATPDDKLLGILASLGADPQLADLSVRLLPSAEGRRDG